MKKFVKVFIIVLLVLAVVGGTVYFFFKKIEEKNNNTGSIVAMLESESKLKFNDDIVKIDNLLNLDGTDNRMELIIETNNNLDEIIYVLSTYYVDSNTSINNKTIADKFKQVNASRELLSRMMAEYNLKAAYNLESDTKCFNMHEGANDVYKQSCLYLKQYAELANLLNVSLADLQKTADFKFSMFEIYTNVAINTFNTTKNNSNIIIVDYSKNIDLINNYFEIDNSYISSTNQFTSYVNKFNEYYNKCDKTKFAQSLFQNTENVTTVNQDTNEEIATYYFKQIYGI